ncbi:MAG: bifunctional diaminohydroxyphosphoribosylaminopyrimidine deaminase/5-amino-6-(5-phosphoribosylamino)uracil reductase RibD [Candidatus Diapherotrites archaeon]|nr:bifunctional diaminohydroxyphosphoribosylaminopyrimidine deaminase/5-amino-6-(5-phosphoribosylamino)uracil reductase RibD [Candidatus Diapherotrites archaeon]
MQSNEKFMAMCLALAEKGKGFVSPNPIVGCVIVKNGKVAGKGFHEIFGGAHAETNALKQAGKKAKGSTLYVNLEPCCHWGKTGPCTKAIIAAGVETVVIAMQDPNPKIRGNGIAELVEAGVKVEIGVLAEQAEKLNEKFVKFMKTGKPFVCLKQALTSDGMVSWGNGKRKRISGKESRERALVLRNGFDAIMVGINTVLKDNPRLTRRSGNFAGQIFRIVLDARLRIPLNAKVFGSDKKAIIVCGQKADRKKERLLQKKCVVLRVKSGNGLISLKELFSRLGRMGISSVLVEGGQTLASSILAENLADNICWVVSKKKAGPEGKFFVDKRVGRLRLENANVFLLGKDAVIEGRPISE